MPNEPTNIIRHIALRPLLRHNSGMHVSVIVTVYNERLSIERLLDSLGRQTRRPDEIVICDGGSRDGTADLVRQYCADNAGVYPPLRLLVEPGANISRGRNLAIDAAQGPVIAATDAGVRLADDRLEQLVAAWDRAVDEPDAPLAVAGFFLPDIDGVFQTAMSATVLPLADDIDPDTFLPSSRSVAFTKQAWTSAGGYPEWLDYCEDLLFDFGINDQVPNRPSGFQWAPDALVHFRPRESLRLVLDPVLSLCARRRQGRSVAQAPCRPLWSLPCAAARLARSCFFRLLRPLARLVGSAGRCRSLLLATATACHPVGTRPNALPTNPGHGAGPVDPGGGRRRQDGRLSRRSLVALLQP